MFPDVTLPGKRIGKLQRPPNLIFIQRASTYISYGLWDKDTREGPRWDIGTIVRNISEYRHVCRELNCKVHLSS